VAQQAFEGLRVANLSVRPHTTIPSSHAAQIETSFRFLRNQFISSGKLDFPVGVAVTSINFT